MHSSMAWNNISVKKTLYNFIYNINIQRYFSDAMYLSLIRFKDNDLTL
jgi:hypothetical protein